MYFYTSASAYETLPQPGLVNKYYASFIVSTTALHLFYSNSDRFLSENLLFLPYGMSFCLLLTTNRCVIIRTAQGASTPSISQCELKLYPHTTKITCFQTL